MTRLHWGRPLALLAALLCSGVALAYPPVDPAPLPPSSVAGTRDFTVTQSSATSSELSAPLNFRLAQPTPPRYLPPAMSAMPAPAPAMSPLPTPPLSRIEHASPPLIMAPPAPSVGMAYGYPAALPAAQAPAVWAGQQSLPAPPMLSTQPLLIKAAPSIYDAAPPVSNLDLLLPDAGGGYVIGAGDTVQIDVLSRPELSAKGNVAGDGRVTVALVGAVHIGGLTPVQAADRIAGAYRQGQFLVSPQVTVTMVDYQSQQFSVLGEVRNPGRFPLRAKVSVLDGLALAGGVNDQGASLGYLLRNKNGVINRFAVDLEVLIQEGGGQRSFPLMAGDTLLVPKTEVFYIYGEVRNPNAYKLKPGMTVIQALSLAGGLTDKGSDKRIERRAGGRDRQVSLNDALAPDDVLYVRERLF